jgi:adenylate cyclase
MDEPEVRQRLAAILAADVAGYSRLMGDDERATIASLNHCRTVFRQNIGDHGGRVVDTAGDSVLAVFDTAIGAARAAMAVQAALAIYNAELPAERRMAWRIGLNSGDIHEQDDGTVYGDGVNIAARVEALAAPGGVSISSKVHEEVAGRLDVAFADQGSHKVKNIARPVRVWGLGDDVRPARRGAKLALAAAVAALVAVAALAIWSDESAEIAADPILALPAGPSIAVLPFIDLDEPARTSTFAAGLTEEIITALTRYRNLFVIARDSTARFGSGTAAAQDLGAAYVLEGSVRRADDLIRVAVKLLDATTGSHVWSETYERTLTTASLFAVQDDITRQVVSTIADSHGIIGQTDLSATRAVPTDSLSAYQCVLRAVAHVSTLSPESHRQSRDCLEAAVATEPSYVDAWAWLSVVYLDEMRFGFNTRSGALDRALEAAQQAVALDERSQFAQLAIARSHFFRHELERFRAAADHALALNPNNATVLAELASLVGNAGEWQRAASLIEKAMALNPYHPDVYYLPLFWNHYRLAEFEAALALLQKTHMPDYYFTHVRYAAVYAELGRQAEAEAAVARILALYPEFPSRAPEIISKWNGLGGLGEPLSAALAKAGLAISGDDCFALAEAFWRQGTAAAHLAARDCTDEQPESAEALALSALLAVDESLYGFNPQSGGPALNRALTMAERGVGLDPESAWAHWALARTAFFRKSVARSDSALEEALRLAPDDPLLRAMAGAQLCDRGDCARGMALLDEAADLDPRQRSWRHAAAFYEAYGRGDDEAALAAAQAMADCSRAHLLRAAAYGQLGMTGEAADALAALRALTPDASIRSTTEMLQQSNHTYPLIARLGDGLRLAGLPER